MKVFATLAAVASGTGVESPLLHLTTEEGGSIGTSLLTDDGLRLYTSGNGYLTESVLEKETILAEVMTQKLEGRVCGSIIDDTGNRFPQSVEGSHVLFHIVDTGEEGNLRTYDLHAAVRKPGETYFTGATEENKIVQLTTTGDHEITTCEGIYYNTMFYLLVDASDNALHVMRMSNYGLKTVSYLEHDPLFSSIRMVPFYEYDTWGLLAVHPDGIFAQIGKFNGQEFETEDQLVASAESGMASIDFPIRVATGQFSSVNMLYLDEKNYFIARVESYDNDFEQFTFPRRFGLQQTTEDSPIQGSGGVSEVVNALAHCEVVVVDTPVSLEGNGFQMPLEEEKCGNKLSTGVYYPVDLMIELGELEGTLVVRLEVEGGEEFVVRLGDKETDETTSTTAPVESEANIPQELQEETGIEAEPRGAIEVGLILPASYAVDSHELTTTFDYGIESTLRVVLDTGMIEVFLDDGIASLTAAVQKPQPWSRVVVEAHNRADIISATLRYLEPINKVVHLGHTVSVALSFVAIIIAFF